MKKWLWLLLLIPLFFLPQLAKPIFPKLIARKIDAQVEIGSLQLSWLGPQRFQQIHWSRPEAKGTLEELTLFAPFWSFSGPLEIKNGSLSYEEGTIGPIQAKMEGEKIDLTVGGDFSLQTSFLYSDHGLNLTRPLSASLRLTPTISRWLLKDMNPLLITALSSNHPIHLQIEPEEFFFPLPFSLRKLHIEKGILDLGQIQCQSGRSLGALITLLKADPLNYAKQISAWFTPLKFRIENGQLHAQRMDILLDQKIHICTWGQIDLIRDQLNMYVGLTADTLRRSFGIKNLPESYVLKMPLRGTTKEPELMTGPAATKIATLMAVQIPKKGPLGKVIDVFSGPKEDKDVPPLTEPLPWK
jgi:hypothetical protein